MDEDTDSSAQKSQTRKKGTTRGRGERPIREESLVKDPSQNSDSSITCVQERNHHFHEGSISGPGGMTNQS